MDVTKHVDRSTRGVIRQLGDGAWIKVVSFGLAQQKKSRELTEQWRAENGKAIDYQPDIEDLTEILHRSVCGTCILDFGGYELDGQPVASQDEAGNFHVANALMLMQAGRQGGRWIAEIMDLSKAEDKAEETALGNSSAPSPTN